MTNKRRIFLSAEWRYLLMLNFEVPPELLLPLVPAGTELDLWEGRALVSVVGFRFLRTKVLGVAVPWHRDFDEVNLRFYVKRLMPDGEVRRGVTFVREIVPRRAIARAARLVYNEPYSRLPVRSIAPSRETDAPGTIEYAWRTSSGWANISATAVSAPLLAKAQSEAAFITEHYWGYTRQRDRGTVEYEVSHPPWKVWEVQSATLSENAAHFYGTPFEQLLARAPHSAFLAAGSPVSVFKPRRL